MYVNGAVFLLARVSVGQWSRNAYHIVAQMTHVCHISNLAV